MAKAHITTALGVNIRLEGTPEEISAVLLKLDQGSASVKAKRGTKKSRLGRVLLGDLIGSLTDGGFFKKPRDLASIKSALAEMGHHYPVTTLSPVMLRQVRRRNLRRLREQKRWAYVS